MGLISGFGLGLTSVFGFRQISVFGVGLISVSERSVESASGLAGSAEVGFGCPRVFCCFSDIRHFKGSISGFGRPSESILKVVFRACAGTLARISDWCISGFSSSRAWLFVSGVSQARSSI